MFPIRVAILASVTLASSAAMAAPTVWALNTNLGINVVDAANNAEVPFIPSPFTSDALAADLGGVLYVADSGGSIYSVQGNALMGNTGYTQIADLYFASGGLWGFSNASDTLFFFDLSSFSVTYSLPITTGLGTHTITGVTQQPSTGDIFLSGNTGNNLDTLFLLDLNTASAATVGSLLHGDTASYISDIEFEGNGTLLAMTWYHREFYTVNPSTAATTFLSTGPHRDVTAFAVTATNVPEPGTWAGALAAGVAVGGALLRRRSIRRQAEGVRKGLWTCQRSHGGLS